MQQLEERRLTDTPRDIPHVPGNCGLLLKVPGGRGGVTGLMTSPNNSDAALTHSNVERGGSILAFIQNKRGEPLMPCHAARARCLLREKKAQVVTRTPFVIRLLHGSSGYKQPVTLGVDSGYTKVGLSALTGKNEVYASEVQLRTDMVTLNSERRTYRRARRARKTWYRRPRFLNRAKSKGWLAPSIQHKLDSQVKLVDRVGKILPISKVIVEVAAFDIQKIKNPDIAELDSQNLEQKDLDNIRQYVLYRDGYRCVRCRGKSKDQGLHTHRLLSGQIGGDRPENLVTLCTTCRDQVNREELKLKVKPSKGIKPETLMIRLRWRLANKLKEEGYEVSPAYGYQRKGDRIDLRLAKSPVNDAFVIASGNTQTRLGWVYRVKQVRKCNRKLWKGARSHIKNVAPRYIKGFQRFDKVRFEGKECFIFGRRSSGYFDLRTLDGWKIHASAKAKDCSLLESAQTLLYERMAIPPQCSNTGSPRQG
jgi:hypothetical protein